MLLLLLILDIQNLLNCEELLSAKFNESLLVDQHRRNLLQVNALLQDLENKTKKISVFRSEDNDTRRDQSIYGKFSVILKKDQNKKNPKNTEPPPVFRLSPQYNPFFPFQYPPPFFYSGYPKPPPEKSPDSLRLVKDSIRELHYPEHQLKPVHSIYPRLMMHPSMISKNGSAVSPYLPSIFRAAGQSIYNEGPLLSHYHIIRPFRPMFAPPLRAPDFVVPEDTLLQDSILTTTIKTTTLGENAKLWFEQIGPYTRVKLKKKMASEDQSRPYHIGTTVPVPPELTEANNDWSSPGLTEPNNDWSTPDMTEPNNDWSSPAMTEPNNDWSFSAINKPNNDWSFSAMTEPNKDWSSPGMTVPNKDWSSQAMIEPNYYWSSPGVTEPKDDWSTIVITDKAQLFNIDQYGVLQVDLAKIDVRPRTTQKDPHGEVSTIAGDVLYGRITVRKSPTTEGPKQRHLDMMQELEEGYLMVFTIEMFRLIAVKDKSELREVLASMKTIYKTLRESGRFAWVDDPLLIFIEKLSFVVSSKRGDSIDVIKTYSSMMFHSLLKRKEVLSDEVNAIIDQAEVFYSDEEGKRLLRSLEQFEDYPNTNKASYSICESLVKNILQPLQRPSVSRSRDRLLDSVNKALRQRFPLLVRNPLRSKFRPLPSKAKQIHDQRKRINHLKKKQKKTPEYNN